MRSLLSEFGVRYRLQRRDLPGCPDVYIGRHKLAVFVNGCFWHGHVCPRGGRSKTNADFWEQKIAANVARDRRSVDRPEEWGIQAVTLWTCEITSFRKVCRQIARRHEKAAK
ncbi:MAG: DNA mismatch endonuclease Vsr [Vulcanimicrobiaceae bacterium]